MKTCDRNPNALVILNQNGEPAFVKVTAMDESRAKNWFGDISPGSTFLFMQGKGCGSVPKILSAIASMDDTLSHSDDKLSGWARQLIAFGYRLGKHSAKEGVRRLRH